MVKLKSALPKAERNGLEAIHAEAVKKPGTKRLALVVLDVATVQSYPSTEAAFEILRIEPIPEEQEQQYAEALEALFEQRTGETRLDLGIEDELDLRTKFKKPKERPTRQRKEPVDLFKQPELEAKPARKSRAKPKPEEDVVDAEVVDEAPFESDGLAEFAGDGNEAA